MSSIRDPEAFRAKLLHFVNDVLPTLSAATDSPSDPVGADTPLFAANRLDSLSILHLIAAVEDLTGEPVPDAMVTMKHFQTIETITQAFCHDRTIA